MTLGFFTRSKTSSDPVLPAAVLTGGKTGFIGALPTPLPDDPVARALLCERYGHIVSGPQSWANHRRLGPTLEKAAKAIDERFALVPEGLVSIPLTIFDQPGQPEQVVETEPFLLARHAVSNAAYQLFVDDGGYEQLELFPEDVWAHLINCKDQTGCAAPRYWRDGRHDKRLADHPVVGICYYEAAAYARWAGYRIPSEAEWQTAASWRIRSVANTERRYPWGDGLDLAKCNIWAAGNGRTLPVHACPEGAAPNGVLQLIGNTWEWTCSDFESADREGRRVVGETLMKGIRGGAYDTYFPWQATATFRSAASCLTRAHNVGFRCALTLPAD